MSLAFTLHCILKLLRQQTISVSTSTWLDVNSVFSSLLFILYVTALEFNITIPFSLSVPGLAGCIIWISQLLQFYFLCFQGIVNRIYLGSFLGYFPHVHSYSTVSDLIYCFLMFSAKFLIVRVVLENQYSFLQSESFN